MPVAATAHPSSTSSAEVQARRIYRPCVLALAHRHKDRGAVYRPCAYPCELYRRHMGRAEVYHGGCPSSNPLLDGDGELLQPVWEAGSRPRSRLCEDEGAVKRVAPADVQVVARAEAQGEAPVGVALVEDSHRRKLGGAPAGGVALVGGCRHRIRGRALDRGTTSCDEAVRHSDLGCPHIVCGVRAEVGGIWVDLTRGRRRRLVPCVYRGKKAW